MLLTAQVDKVSLNTTLLLLSLSLFLVIHTFYSIEWRTSKFIDTKLNVFTSAGAGAGCCRETRLMSVSKWRQAWWARYNNGLMWGRYPVSSAHWTLLCIEKLRYKNTSSSTSSVQCKYWWCSAALEIGPGLRGQEQGRGWGNQTKVAARSYQEPATFLPPPPSRFINCLLSLLVSKNGIQDFQESLIMLSLDITKLPAPGKEVEKEMWND